MIELAATPGASGMAASVFRNRTARVHLVQARRPSRGVARRRLERTERRPGPGRELAHHAGQRKGHLDEPRSRSATHSGEPAHREDAPAVRRRQEHHPFHERAVGDTNNARRSRSRVSGRRRRATSGGFLKARSQNRGPLSIAVILVRSPPWLCPITTIRRRPGSVPLVDRAASRRARATRAGASRKDDGTARSHTEKNQNSYRSRTRVGRQSVAHLRPPAERRGGAVHEHDRDAPAAVRHASRRARLLAVRERQRLKEAQILLLPDGRVVERDSASTAVGSVSSGTPDGPAISTASVTSGRAPRAWPRAAARRARVARARRPKQRRHRQRQLGAQQVARSGIDVGARAPRQGRADAGLRDSGPAGRTPWNSAIGANAVMRRFCQVSCVSIEGDLQLAERQVERAAAQHDLPVLVSLPALT